jgi:hypothetical protein
MAALRVYLALALVADFDAREASVSWSTMQEQTGLSRPMVLKGIETAEKTGLISVDKSSHRHSYHLLRQADEEVAFTQVPLLELRKALPEMPTRGFHALDALKLYITLLTVRFRNSDRAAIGHKKIWVRTGIQLGRIRAAADVLIDRHLIHVESADPMGVGGHPYNEYLLIGFSNRSPVQSSAPAAAAVTAPSGPPVLVKPAPEFLMPWNTSHSDDSPF